MPDSSPTILFHHIVENVVLINSFAWLMAMCTCISWVCRLCGPTYHVVHPRVCRLCGPTYHVVHPGGIPFTWSHLIMWFIHGYAVYVVPPYHVVHPRVCRLCGPTISSGSSMGMQFMWSHHFMWFIHGFAVYVVYTFS